MLNFLLEYEGSLINILSIAVKKLGYQDDHHERGEEES